MHSSRFLLRFHRSSVTHQDAVALNNAMSSLHMAPGEGDYGEGLEDEYGAGMRLRQPLDASQLDDEYDDYRDEYGGHDSAEDSGTVDATLSRRAYYDAQAVKRARPCPRRNRRGRRSRRCDLT